MTRSARRLAATLLIGAVGAGPSLAAERAPQCDARRRTFAHTDRDGHDHTTGPEHRGHRHGEKKRNFKGYALKPRCLTALGELGDGAASFINLIVVDRSTA